MTQDQSPDKRLVIADLERLARIGYRSGRAQQVSQVELLIRLRVAGGPNLPNGTMEWHGRRESLRSLIGSIAANEVQEKLGEKYADATCTLFRLDAPRPLELQNTLNDLQAELSESFGETDPRGFLNHHRGLLFEVIAEALIQREQEAINDLEEAERGEKTPADHEPDDLDREAPVPPNDDKDEEATDSTQDASSPEPPDTEPSPVEETRPKPTEQEPSDEPAPSPLIAASAPSPSIPTRASRSRNLSGTARALIGIVALIAVAAAVLLVIRNQSPGSGQEKSETTRQAQTSPSPAATAPSKDPPNAPAVPPIDFTAEVVNWCYCGDSDTLESQIKIKPRFVNHAARRVDLRTGGSARLGLAFYAKASSDRSWITPTEPRYRRYGKWLVVPPNAPGDLTSPTMFETHWERTSLRPLGEYLDPDHYEGDLVFNVPPDIVLGAFNVRLAYRLRSGDLYFPRKGAHGYWRGNEEGKYF